MTFKEEIESEFQEILEGEFSDSVSITSPQFPKETVTGFFEKNFLESDEVGNQVLSNAARFFFHKDEVEKEFLEAIPEDGSKSWIINFNDNDYYIGNSFKMDTLCMIKLVKK